MTNLPRNAKEGIIFGIFMCLFMVLFMSFLNITYNFGGVNSESLTAWGVSLPIIFVVAFAVENIIVNPITNFIINKIYKERSNNSILVCLNAIIIVPLMSIIMTILGELIGGFSIVEIFSEFLTTWPRNFCAAFFFNLIIAGPLARLILKGFQALFDKKSNAISKKTSTEQDNNQGQLVLVQGQKDVVAQSEQKSEINVNKLDTSNVDTTTQNNVNTQNEFSKANKLAQN